MTNMTEGPSQEVVDVVDDAIVTILEFLVKMAMEEFGEISEDTASGIGRYLGEAMAGVRNRAYTGGRNGWLEARRELQDWPDGLVS